MPVKSTDFHSADRFVSRRDFDDIEFEPIGPEKPVDSDNIFGCCKCSDEGYCERNEIAIGSSGAWALGVTAGSFVGM